MNKAKYDAALRNLQTELVHLQQWVVKQKLRVIILFEGRDASGKGGVIKAITQRLNPRVVRIAALPKPTEYEQQQWYFQRYIKHFPSGGEIVLFDRSWYNRAGVEKVMGFCTEEEHQAFLETCPIFEKMLLDSGIILLKYWFSVSDKEQEKRFLERINNPMKRWKFSNMDLYSRSQWVTYSRAKDEMFAKTDTKKSPWYIVEADDKRKARLNCISHILNQIPYQELEFIKPDLPRIHKIGYKRPPKHHFNWIDKVY